MASTATLEQAMSDAIDRLEHAAMVARETDDTWWEWLAAEREREADAAIAAFHAALDADAADERRDEALWQRDQERRERAAATERQTLYVACNGDDGPF